MGMVTDIISDIKAIDKAQVKRRAKSLKHSKVARLQMLIEYAKDELGFSEAELHCWIGDREPVIDLQSIKDETYPDSGTEVTMGIHLNDSFFCVCRYNEREDEYIFRFEDKKPLI